MERRDRPPGLICKQEVGGSSPPGSTATTVFKAWTRSDATEGTLPRVTQRAAAALRQPALAGSAAGKAIEALTLAGSWRSWRRARAGDYAPAMLAGVAATVAGTVAGLRARRDVLRSEDERAIFATCISTSSGAQS